MSEKREIRSLTGLRGVAACMVMFFHASLPPGAGDGGPFLIIIRHGYLWVDFFFVLSGFVMALTYSRDFLARGTARAFPAFIAQRIARIWPLYIFASVVMLPFSPVWHGGATTWLQVTGRAVANLLMIQSWGFSPSMNLNAWSISTEWLAYMTFPALLWLALRSGKHTSMIVAAGCVLILCGLTWLPAIAIWQGGLATNDPYSANPLFRCLAEFTLGLLAFRASQIFQGQAVAASRVAAPMICILIVALFTTSALDAVIAALFPLLVLSLSQDRGVVARMLGSKPIHWLGMLSYSIYLLHPLFSEIRWHLQWRLEAANVPHAAFLPVLIMLCGTILASMLTLYYVERPGRMLLRRALEPKRKPTSIEQGTLAVPQL